MPRDDKVWDCAISTRTLSSYHNDINNLKIPVRPSVTWFVDRIYFKFWSRAGGTGVVRDSMRRTRTKLHHVAKHLVCYLHPCNYILSCTKTSHNTIIYHLQCVLYLVRIIILLLYRARPRRGARSSAASRFPCSRGDGTRYTICFGKKTQFFSFLYGTAGMTRATRTASVTQ